jgi:5-methylcytosine-specific restriction endonuclease McrA
MLKRSPIKKISDKQRVKLKSKAEQTKKLHEWFLEVWKEREEFDSNGRGYVTCFETGKKLYSDYYMSNSCCYSHLIPKSKRPDLAMEDFNLKIVHPDCHAQYETFPEKAPKQYALRQELLNKLINGK